VRLAGRGSKLPEKRRARTSRRVTAAGCQRTGRIMARIRGHALIIKIAHGEVAALLEQPFRPTMSMHSLELHQNGGLAWKSRPARERCRVRFFQR